MVPYRIFGHTVPEAWEEFKWTFYLEAIEEESRVGPVLSIPTPMMTEVRDPTCRVMFDPGRDCNPFFHMMEFIWMMAGSKDLGWIRQFNSKMEDFSDDQETLPASYGYRWRRHFNLDQIIRILNQLRAEPTSRRIVLSMWDPGVDLAKSKSSEGLDKPCNTQIYFRVHDGRLDMLVTNRSNDAIWGMFGTNAVHMTMLQELIALGTGLKIGSYRVVSNNLHIYKNLPRLSEIMDKTRPCTDYYSTKGYRPLPLLQKEETVEDFLKDSENFLLGREVKYCEWFNNTAELMRTAYLDKPNRLKIVADVSAQDWRVAATQWAERHV